MCHTYNLYCVVVYFIGSVLFVYKLRREIYDDGVPAGICNGVSSR
jgi:hypothetical protein